MRTHKEPKQWHVKYASVVGAKQQEDGDPGPDGWEQPEAEEQRGGGQEEGRQAVLRLQAQHRSAGQTGQSLFSHFMSYIFLRTL